MLKRTQVTCRDQIASAFMKKVLAPLRSHHLCNKLIHKIMIEKQKLSNNDVSQFYLCQEFAYFRHVFDEIIQLYPFYKRDPSLNIAIFGIVAAINEKPENFWRTLIRRFEISWYSGT